MRALSVIRLHPTARLLARDEQQRHEALHRLQLGSNILQRARWLKVQGRQRANSPTGVPLAFAVFSFLIISNWWVALFKRSSLSRSWPTRCCTETKDH